MQAVRWALTLVITLMLIDSWVSPAEARSTDPARPTASSRCADHPAIPLRIA